MLEACFVCSIKYRTLRSKQRTDYRDLLWLYPVVRLANSLEEVDISASIHRQRLGPLLYIRGDHIYYTLLLDHDSRL
jgi:hypothetical protein